MKESLGVGMVGVVVVVQPSMARWRAGQERVVEGDGGIYIEIVSGEAVFEGGEGEGRYFGVDIVLKVKVF